MSVLEWVSFSHIGMATIWINFCLILGIFMFTSDIFEIPWIILKCLVKSPCVCVFWCFSCCSFLASFHCSGEIYKVIYIILHLLSLYGLTSDYFGIKLHRLVMNEAVGSKFLYMSLMSFWSTASLKSHVSLWI
jgi:hypothetical protein